jgi:predicted translin family RNA/ssDNA-binding protein
LYVAGVSQSSQQQPHAAAVQNVAEAHRLLKRLRERLDKHPELEQAIEKLERALNELTLKTGGML